MLEKIKLRKSSLIAYFYAFMMKMKKIYSIFWILLMVGLLFSCKKNEESLPLIVIETPGNMADYKVGDSIAVKATITHDRRLSFVRVQLIDGQPIPLLTPRYLYPDGSSFTVDILYPLDDLAMESGIYELMITASDYENRSHSYRSIQINGLVQEFQKLLVFCTPNSLNTLVYGVEQNDSAELIFDLPYGYYASAVNCTDRQLFMIREQAAVLMAYDLDELEFIFGIEGVVPYPEFNSVVIFDRLAWACCDNGDIKAYDNISYPRYVSESSPDTVPVLLSPGDDYVVAYCEARVGPRRFLRQYYRATGVFRDAMEIPYRLVAMFRGEAGEVIGIWSENGSSGIIVYHPEGNYLAEEYVLPQGEVHDAVSAGPNKFLICHESGIYEYLHEVPYIPSWMGGFEAEQIAYDQSRQLVYLSNANVVSIYSYGNATLVDEFTMPYPVSDLQIQYNK